MNRHFYKLLSYNKLKFAIDKAHEIGYIISIRKNEQMKTNPFKTMKKKPGGIMITLNPDAFEKTAKVPMTIDGEDIVVTVMEEKKNK